MATINPNTQPAYWVIPSHVLDGVTGLGQVTCVNNALTVIYAEGETAFLDAAKAIGAYKPLPPAGTLVQAGEIYGYGGGLVIIRQTHNRTADAPDTIPALISVYRASQVGPMEWVPDEKVLLGTQRTYGGKTYKCLQPHTTQADWPPDKTPAMWSEVAPPPVTGAWAYPVAYKINDLVTYGGLTYKCRQAHTSQAGWTPPAVLSLWLPV